jgi:putative YhdH/YhfP family quinone oxidoreductase
VNPTTGFRAIRAVERDGAVSATVETCTVADLPAGELLLRVDWSSLNYKDALSLAGNRGVTRAYPHTPGIDLAGEVIESSDPAVPPGSSVICHGYDLGMNSWGGFSEYVRVPAAWTVSLPAGISRRDAMAYGTAGFTAALSVERIDRILRPDGGSAPDGSVVVSGASGGVGSIAVAMLAGLGYAVTASTGRSGDADARARLIELGAREIVDRETLIADADRPISRSRWIAGVDTTGGTILAGMVKAAGRQAPITACGLTRDADLPLTVFPFILRGVQLIGIDSVETPREERARVWIRIAGDLRHRLVEDGVREVSLEEVPAVAAALLRGEHQGRTVVRVCGGHTPGEGSSSRASDPSVT